MSWSVDPATAAFHVVIGVDGSFSVYSHVGGLVDSEPTLVPSCLFVRLIAS